MTHFVHIYTLLVLLFIMFSVPQLACDIGEHEKNPATKIRENNAGKELALNSLIEFGGDSGRKQCVSWF